MQKIVHSRLLPYGVAIVAVLIALLVTLKLDSWFSVANSPFLLFFSAIMVSAWYGGLKPGVLATLGSGFVSTYFLLLPQNSFVLDNGEFIRLLIFEIQGLLISGLCDALKTAKQRSEATLFRLKTSEERFRLALSNSTVSIFQQDEALRYLWIHTPKGSVNLENILYKSDFDLFPSDEAETLTRLKREAIAQHSVVHQEVDLTVSGERRSYDLIIQPLYTENRQPNGITCIAVNITERKRIEQQLQEAIQQSVLILESITDAFFAVDREWRFTYVNQRFEQMTHHTRQDLLGQCIWEVFPESVGSVFYQAYQQAIAKQTAITVEAPNPSDSRHWYEARAYPSESGLAVYFQNITIRKQAEVERHQLLLREQTARTKAEAMQRQLALLDSASRVLAASLDYETALQTVIDFIVPELADLCTIDILQADRSLNPLVAVKAQPTEKATLVQYLTQHYPLDLDNPHQPITAVLRTGRSAFLPDVKDETYQAIAQDEEHLALLRQLGIRSAICVSLQSPGDRFGVLTLALLHADKRYNVEDLTLAEELGRRVGIAIANARLHRQLQQAMQQKEEALALFNAWLASSPIALAFLDTDLRYVYVNQALANANGLPVLAHLGHPLREVLPEWATELEPVLHQVMQTREPLLNQEVNGETNPPGVYRYSLVNYYPVSLPDGRLLGVGVTGLDVTDLKLSEYALRASEERYRSLVMASSQIVWRANAAGEIIDVQGWEEFTGQPSEDLIVHRNMDAIHPDDLPEVRAVWYHSMTTRQPYSYEHRLRKWDGTYEYFSIRGVPILDEQGQVQEWVGMTSNINDRKQVQVEQERLLQLEQTARSEAERANRIKDEFLAILSHELRSPLNPILGWAKLLRTRPMDELSRNRGLETIERNAKLQSQLIEDLLDVSRILRGKLTLNAVPVDLLVCIQGAMETVQLAAEAKAIELQFQWEEPSPTTTDFYVMGDAARLQQIVWNLLSNAIKFTPQGGRVALRLEPVWITGEPSPSLPAPTQAQLTITDTGKGITADFLPYIFDHFRQADSTTTRKFGGLGLGLAIVRHLVELHGGIVWAESPGEGQGATFRVQLPLMRGHTSLPPTSEDGHSPTSSLSFPLLRQIRILAVDDEADMRHYITQVLQQSEAQFEVVASAQEVLNRLPHFKPDVLLSDIGMPEIDGYMLLRQIKTTMASQPSPMVAIALTAYAGEYDQQRAQEAGFQLHLAKPIEPERLLQAIAQLVG